MIWLRIRSFLLTPAAWVLLLIALTVTLLVVPPIVGILTFVAVFAWVGTAHSHRLDEPIWKRFRALSVLSTGMALVALLAS